MDTVFTGRIWKLPDDVDTDTIIPGRYGVLPSAEEMSRHCLEPLRPELAAAARPGDIFVAGKNFGCGSSREFAPACIAALGVRCIVAKSFARIFYRNGINNGMLLIETDDLYDRCEEGDLLTVEVNRCLKVNGQVIPIRQIPDNLFEIIKAGGLVPRYRALNEAAEAAESVQKEVFLLRGICYASHRNALRLLHRLCFFYCFLKERKHLRHLKAILCFCILRCHRDAVLRLCLAIHLYQDNLQFRDQIIF